MTERNHPLEDQALALADDARFCEWLNTISALSSGWPHSRYTARRWLADQCEVASFAHLATDPAGAAAFQEIAHRFALWDRNGELPL